MRHERARQAKEQDGRNRCGQEPRNHHAKGGQAEQAGGCRPVPQRRIRERSQEAVRVIEFQIPDGVDALRRVAFPGAENDVMVPVRIPARLRLNPAVIRLIVQGNAVLEELDVQFGRAVDVVRAIVKS